MAAAEAYKNNYNDNYASTMMNGLILGAIFSQIAGAVGGRYGFYMGMYYFNNMLYQWKFRKMSAEQKERHLKNYKNVGSELRGDMKAIKDKNVYRGVFPDYDKPDKQVAKINNKVKPLGQ